jgi:hypothetical protein
MEVPPKAILNEVNLISIGKIAITLKKSPPNKISFDSMLDK